jgi:hypothetical protein
VNNAAARYILDNGSVPANVTALRGVGLTDIPDLTPGVDWAMIFTNGNTINGGPSINVQVIGQSGTISRVTSSKDIPLPVE